MCERGLSDAAGRPQVIRYTERRGDWQIAKSVQGADHVTGWFQNLLALGVWQAPLRSDEGAVW
jgi:hypothetical protein